MTTICETWGILEMPKPVISQTMRTIMQCFILAFLTGLHNSIQIRWFLLCKWNLNNLNYFCAHFKSGFRHFLLMKSERRTSCPAGPSKMSLWKAPTNEREKCDLPRSRRRGFQRDQAVCSSSRKGWICCRLGDELQEDRTSERSGCPRRTEILPQSLLNSRCSMRKFMFSANWWLSKSREWPKQNESVWYVRDCKPFVRQFAIWYGRLRLFKSAKEIPRTDPHCLIKTFSFNAWNVADISHFHLDNLKIPPVHEFKSTWRNRQTKKISIAQ